MHNLGQVPTSLFRNPLLTIAALLVVVATLGFTQNATPPPAAQPAKMPPAPLAKRLLPKAPARQPTKRQNRPLDSDLLYDNGPINGGAAAWNVTPPFVASNSFKVWNDNT